MVIKGDIVRHPDYGIGHLAHTDDSGRWVIFKNLGGHWQAGSYDEEDLEYVSPPESSQARLKLSRIRQAE